MIKITIRVPRCIYLWWKRRFPTTKELLAIDGFEIDAETFFKMKWARIAANKHTWEFTGS